jgi:hypothetical protein
MIGALSSEFPFLISTTVPEVLLLVALRESARDLDKAVLIGITELIRGMKIPIPSA